MSEEHYNKQSVDLRRIAYPCPADHAVQPGDFSWSPAGSGSTRYLYLCLPGDKHLDAIRVQKGDPGSERVWGWDGNEDAPTVTPSIHWEGHWHGFLKAGRLVSI